MQVTKEKHLSGKSWIREYNGVYILRSYSERNYAASYKGILVRISPVWSMTSMRHLSAFANQTNSTYYGCRPSKALGGKHSPYALHNLMWVKGDRYTDEKTISARVKRAVNRFLKKREAATANVA